MNLARQEVDEVCSLRSAELEQLHRTQRETLELELSWLPKPRIKYTNHYLELQKTKDGCATCCGWNGHDRCQNCFFRDLSTGKLSTPTEPDS